MWRLDQRSGLRAAAAAGVMAWLALCSSLASAALPAAYGALVVQPSGLPERAEFDLTAAAQQARSRGLRLYVYLGASDCAYCRRYENFLNANAQELIPHFKPYLIVDLRSSLRITAERLFIRVDGRSLPYAEFQRSIGDERARQLVYPSVWLFDGKIKPLMQMPAGNGTFETVPEQLEILRLEQ